MGRFGQNRNGQRVISQTASGRAGSLHAIAVRAAELTFALLIGLLAANLLWTLIAGSYRTHLDVAQEATDDARRSATPPAIQGSAAGLLGARASAPSQPVETLPESQLGFSLFGVRTGSAPDEGSAIIEVGANGQRSFAAGSELQPGVVLDEVHPDRVVLNRRGAREVIYLTERARTRQQAAAGGLSPVTLAGLSFVPMALQSGGEGLQLRSEPGPLGALGLQTGDIIASIEGEPVSDALAASLSARLANGEMPSSLTLERDGARLTLQTRPNP